MLYLLNVKKIRFMRARELKALAIGAAKPTVVFLQSPDKNKTKFQIVWKFSDLFEKILEKIFKIMMSSSLDIANFRLHIHYSIFWDYLHHDQRGKHVKFDVNYVFNMPKRLVFTLSQASVAHNCVIRYAFKFKMIT